MSKAILISVVCHAPDLLRLPDSPQAAASVAPKKVSKVIYAKGAWEILHLRALRSKGEDDGKWLREVFASHVPCGECTMHWKQMLQRTPPEWHRYFKWTVDRHNEVNRRIGKQVIGYGLARAYWTAQMQPALPAAGE